MERRSIDLAAAQIRAMGPDDKPICAGYASVFYDGTPRTQYDLGPGLVERIHAGAFDRALREADDCRALFNHDPNCVLGRTSSGTCRLAIDKAGLRYEIDLPNTQLAADLRESIKRGDITGSSFSFEITDVDWTREDGLDVRNIRGVKLWDVGPVTYPAYTATSTDARALDLERWKHLGDGDAEDAARITAMEVPLSS